MSEILITGGAGFIGSSLADRLLSRGEKVVVVDNMDPYYSPSLKMSYVKSNLRNSNYKFYETDILDFEGLNQVFKSHKIDHVVHLAARAGVRPSILNPSEYIKTNISGTNNILELMRTHEVKRMTFASSSSVYGNSTKDFFIEDDVAAFPISPYAATKLSCEQMCHVYHHLHGLSVTCLRFFTVYGPRQRPDLAIMKFFNLIENQQTIPMFGDGESVRDYTYIDDLLDGVEAAMAFRASPFEIINLGGGKPISLNGVIEGIENALQKKALIEKLPKQMGDVDKTIASISKAKLLLNYNPKFSFSEGLAKQASYFRNTLA